MYCLVEAEGPTKVLTFSESPLLSAEVALVEKEAVAKQKLLLNVPRLGLSLIDDSPQELLYLSAQALHLGVESSAAALELHLSLNWLQLDNQLVVTQQPVLLRPNPAAHARNPYVLQVRARARAGVRVSYPEP